MEAKTGKVPDIDNTEKATASNAVSSTSTLAAALGPWAQTIGRKFLWRRLRFDTVFQTPYVGIASTDANAPYNVDVHSVWAIDGSPKSRRQTMTGDDSSEGEATWITLLRALQDMERDSQRWHAEQHFQDVPEDEPPLPLMRGRMPQFYAKRQMTAFVRPQQQRWTSFSTTSHGRPCATSTMKELIVLVAMLGLSWTEFDPVRHQYHATGYGYELTGCSSSGDICFTLCQTSAGPVGLNSPLGASRMVPSLRAAFLCFGRFPSIFAGRDYAYPPLEFDPWRLLDESATTPKHRRFPPEVLGTANDAEIVKTLLFLGVPKDMADLFVVRGRQTGHMLPLHFELMGMLCQVFRLPGTYFRVLPNPTDRCWDSRPFAASFPHLLGEYKARLEKLRPWLASGVDVSDGDILDILALLDDDTVELISSEDTCHRMAGLDALSRILETCNDFLARTIGRERVVKVVALHVAEVLRLFVNDSNADLVDVRYAGQRPRAQNLMRFYFDEVRPFIVSGGDPLLSAAERDGFVHPLRPPPPTRTLREHLQKHLRRDRKLEQVQRLQSQPPPQNQNQNTQHRQGQLDEAVWLWLVLRMLCWLRLHAFQEYGLVRPPVDFLFRLNDVTVRIV